MVVGAHLPLFICKLPSLTRPSCWLLQAFGAVEAYGVQLVVANELHSRKDRVWLVARQEGSSEDGESGGRGSGNGGSGGGGGMAVQQIERPADTPVIETLLVAEVVTAHRRHMHHTSTSISMAVPLAV